MINYSECVHAIKLFALVKAKAFILQSILFCYSTPQVICSGLNTFVQWHAVFLWEDVVFFYFSCVSLAVFRCDFGELTVPLQLCFISVGV